MKFLKPRLKVFLLAIPAGIFVSLGAILNILMIAYLPYDYINPFFIGALLFSLGTVGVCYLKLNLYTGKIGVIFKDKTINKEGLNVFEYLGIILLGNFVGTLIIGLSTFGLLKLEPNGVLSLLVKAIGESRNTPFELEPLISMLLRSTACGVLIYIAVYNFKNMSQHFGKIVGVIVPITLFVYVDFQNSISNMFYLSASGTWTWNYLVSLLLTIFGNSLGAILIGLVVKTNSPKLEVNK